MRADPAAGWTASPHPRRPLTSCRPGPPPRPSGLERVAARLRRLRLGLRSCRSSARFCSGGFNAPVVRALIGMALIRAQAALRGDLAVSKSPWSSCSMARRRWRSAWSRAGCAATAGSVSRPRVGGRLGTADPFQGQEAPVTIHSLTTGDGESTPGAWAFRSIPTASTRRSAAPRAFRSWWAHRRRALASAAASRRRTGSAASAA